jgi:hypothetical protein
MSGSSAVWDIVESGESNETFAFTRNESLEGGFKCAHHVMRNCAQGSRLV